MSGLGALDWRVGIVVVVVAGVAAALYLLNRRKQAAKTDRVPPHDPGAYIEALGILHEKPDMRA
jgi:ammonia channel protein AmtB